MKIEDAFSLVRKEVASAAKKHKPYNSAHEGASVIREEYEEFWDEVKADNLPRAIEEVTQVAATAIRFLMDINA